MDKKEELTQIVEAVQKDRGQFELLYSQIVKKVYFWCYSVIGNESDALDASQEAMVRIYNKLHTLKHPGGFTSWMYILVRNVCYRYLDNQKRKEYEFFDDHDFSGKLEENITEYRREVLPDEIYDLNETKRLVGEFIEKLPDKQKEAIILYYLEEMSIGEISEIIDEKVGTVKSRLHAGRKQIEEQVNAYQEKHNVKLYTSSLISILGYVLYEYMNDVCDKQTLRFDNSIHNSAKLSKLSKLLNTLSSNIYIAIGVVSVISAVGVFALFTTIADDNKVIDKINFTNSFVDDVEMFNKVNSNPYIESINYLTFPTREPLEVNIKLKKEVNQQNIKILYDDKEVLFEQSENNILVQIKENGNYTIAINGKRVSFEIDTIDEFAPELTDVINHKDSLEFLIHDENNQINYEKSYVENNGRIYKINEDLKVYGEFKGYTRIIIFNKNDLHIDYVLHFE